MKSKNLISVTHSSFCHVDRDFIKRCRWQQPRIGHTQIKLASASLIFPREEESGKGERSRHRWQKRSHQAVSVHECALPLFRWAAMPLPSVPGCLYHPNPLHLVNSYCLFNSVSPPSRPGSSVQQSGRTTFLILGRFSQFITVHSLGRLLINICLPSREWALWLRGLSGFAHPCILEQCPAQSRYLMNICCQNKQMKLTTGFYHSLLP